MPAEPAERVTRSTERPWTTPIRTRRAAIGLGHIALLLGVVALALGGSGLAIALTHAGPAGSTGATGSQGAQGPQGPPGSEGTRGANGTNATNLWAIVSANGSLISGKGADASTTMLIDRFPGQYQVGFDQDVAACSYVATPYAGDYPAAFTVVAPRLGSEDAVFVEIYDSSGTATNASFDVAVFC